MRRVRALFDEIAVKAVYGHLLSPLLLILRYRLARDRVKDVAALTGQPLEVVGHIYCRQIGRGVPCVGFGLLLLPPGVE